MRGGGERSECCCVCVVSDVLSRSARVTTPGDDRHARRDGATLLLVRLGLPFFYGYVVLVVATFGKIMSAPGQSPCIGVVVDCLMSSLGLSLTMPALYLVATVGSAASLPKVGSLVDKFGVQKSVGLVSILLGGACFLLSICSNAVLLLLCFYLLRLLGQGAIFLVSQNAINLWFVRLRGLVMGLAAAGATLGITSLSPSLMQTGLATIGWRRTYVMLGFVCLGFSLIGFAFYREAPEQYGLLPDGDKPRASLHPTAPPRWPPQPRPLRMLRPEQRRRRRPRRMRPRRRKESPRGRAPRRFVRLPFGPCLLAASPSL